MQRMQRNIYQVNKRINRKISKCISILYINGDLNKIVLLLGKCVYPYEYMDSWERFDETSLPDKEAFCSELNLEDVTDKDYEQAQNVWEVSEINNLGEYHDLYLQCDTLLLYRYF